MAFPAKGIHRVRGKLRDGTSVEYHYAWRKGPRFWASNTAVQKHSPEYWAAYQDACAERRHDRGLFREVLTAYLDSPQFKKLGARTQKDKRASIFHPKNGIERRFGDAPLGVFNRTEVRRVAYEWLDDIDSDRVSDMRRSDLVSIVAWAVDRGFLTTHHLQRMTPRYSVDRSEIVWTDAEIEAFTQTAPKWVSRILVAATETGLRPGDLIKLNRGHIQTSPNGQRRIFMRTAKRGKIVAIPVTPKMSELIDATPKDRLHILANATGGPFINTNYPMKQIREWRRKTGLRDELHLHDARGTAATRLFEADASLREIANHMGWSVQHTAKMIEVYVSRNPEISDDLLIRLQSAR